MKDEQTRGAILQWLVPVFVLIVIVIVMLFDFSVKTNREAADKVENSLIERAERYASQVNYELVRMADAGKTIGFLLKDKDDLQLNKRVMVRMAEALFTNTQAYAVVYYSDESDGLRDDGTKAAVSKTKYFPQIQETLDLLAEDGKTMVSGYIYTENDELGDGKEAIIAAIPLESDKGGDMLLMYYPVENIEEIFRKAEFDTETFYAIVDAEGEFIEKDGTESLFTAGTNLWDVVKQNPSYDQEGLGKTIVRMKNHISGIFEAQTENENRVLVYAPIGINDWNMLIGINKDYVEDQKNKEWSKTKYMVYQLAAAMLIFFGLVAILNIFNRIRSSEKNRELEEKANSDQLTGLYNKLSTERKIKEYIACHPGEQCLMFVLDIDNFKKINDTLGHAFGDEVLRSLGREISAVFRASDIIGRTGGDEFTIFLKGLNDDAVLEKEAAKLSNFFKHFQAGEYIKYAVTASIGAAVYSKDGRDFETLYKAADNALYTAKKRGKSQLVFYGAEEEKSENRKKVETESYAGRD